MTEAEIMKALECCQTTYNRNCGECPYRIYKSTAISTHSCSEYLRKDLLDLINRKNAEIDSLFLEIKELNEVIKKITLPKGCIAITLEEIEIETAKAEAIKEFAERVKADLTTGWAVMRISVLHIIDQIAKEMGVE